MSTINHEAIAQRLTRDRLRSYLAATKKDVPAAIALYDWNAQVGGALHEDRPARSGVPQRHRPGAVTYGTALGWPTVWYQRDQVTTYRRRDSIPPELALERTLYKACLDLQNLKQRAAAGAE